MKDVVYKASLQESVKKRKGLILLIFSLTSGSSLEGERRVIYDLPPPGAKWVLCSCNFSLS